MITTRAVSTFAVVLTLSLGCATAPHGRTVVRRDPTGAREWPKATGAWEDLDLTFLEPGVTLYWVPQLDTMDEWSAKWLQHLGPDKSDYAYRVGAPWAAFLRLAIVRGGHFSPVAWPGDLRGSVRLKTPQDALSFIRLFSSVDTYDRFSEYGWLEIEQVGPASSSQPTRFACARVPKADFARLGLCDAQIEECEEGFRFCRSVVRADWLRATEVAILDETVGRDGEYVRRVLWRKALPPEMDLVHLPMLK
jgi:hypothetical protein